MRAHEIVMSQLVAANNRRIVEHAVGEPNPLPLGSATWHGWLVDALPAIRAEWLEFSDGRGRLPRLQDVLGEDQGSEGSWTAGLLIAGGRPCPPLTEHFPRTVHEVRRIPGLRSALWSVMAPGAKLPEHTGPNAGVLRYHLGVYCGAGAALRLRDTVIPYRDGAGVLFDDTVPHAAWNRGEHPRVTLFCEVERPLPVALALPNMLTQRLLSLDPRYRRARARAAEWYEALNRRPDSSESVPVPHGG